MRVKFVYRSHLRKRKSGDNRMPEKSAMAHSQCNLFVRDEIKDY